MKISSYLGVSVHKICGEKIPIMIENTLQEGLKSV
jgi:hypothetical protein